MADDSITVTREETAKLLAEIESIRKRMATDGIADNGAVIALPHEGAAKKGPVKSSSAKNRS